MLITFNSMGYDYISKICFDFLKRIIPHTSSALKKSLHRVRETSPVKYSIVFPSYTCLIYSRGSV